MKKISEGRTAEVYTYEQNKVLKLYYEPFALDTIEYEFKLSQLVNSLKLYSPLVYEIVKEKNRYGIIFDKIEGSSFFEALMQTHHNTDDLAILFADTHFSIHNCALDNIADLSYIRSQKAELIHYINDSKDLNMDEKVKLVNILKALPDGSKLCHGDYHPDNVLIGKQNWIIDWMTATMGNPLGDVARTIVILRYASIPRELSDDIHAQISEKRNDFLQAYIDRYLTLSKHTLDELEKWLLPVAASRLVEWLSIEEKNNLLEFIRGNLT